MMGVNPVGNHRMRIDGVDVGPPDTMLQRTSYGSFEDYQCGERATQLLVRHQR